MTKDEIKNYWVSSSDKDLRVMNSLYKKAITEGYITKIKDFRRWLKKRIKE